VHQHVIFREFNVERVELLESDVSDTNQSCSACCEREEPDLQSFFNPPLLRQGARSRVSAAPAS
jgi:hypothetical protein